jgi:putative zinc finger/helix-turn-helix YgiT family protein
MIDNFKIESEKDDVCPTCEDMRRVETGTRIETVQIRNESVEVDANVQRCTYCGNFFSSGDEDEATIQKAYRKFRERRGLLQPEQIRELREQYGLGQRAFARILGWGEITIHRYEAGSIQDEAHNDTLMLVRDADSFARLYEKNRKTLSRSVSQKVDEHLIPLMRDRQEKYFVEYLASNLNEPADLIISGNRKFDLERFESVILYFCGKLDHVYKTKLNKLLWYYDFITFKHLDRSATGASYVHLPLGPVPDNYDFFLADLIRKGSLEANEIVFDVEKGVTGEWFKAFQKPDLDLFSDEELRFLDQVAKRLGDMGARELSDLSHGEDGYAKTKKGEFISYEWAKNIRLFT